jgi:uncharacterized iron-regulated membrane protein
MTERKNRNRLWFALHGWCALPIWLFLFFVCVTGTIATVDKEIMWLIDPSVRATNPDNLQRKPLNEVMQDVQRQIPGVNVARIGFGEPYMALEMRIATPDTPNAVAWVNPYTGDVQRIARGLNFSNFVKSLHGWLLMPWFGGTPIGWYAVTLLGLPMLGSVITGIMVYKRFWRAFVTPRLRLRNGSRVFWGDVHRLAGAWSLWFVFVIAVTGLWFLVRGVMFDMHVSVGMEDPDIPRREAPVLMASDPRPVWDVDGALAAVQAVRPGVRPLGIMLPEHALGTFSVYSRSTFLLLAEEAWVHPYSLDVMGVRDASVASNVEVISTLNASLHYGNFGGVWVKLIWTFFGILLSTLVASGTVIWTKRTAQAMRRAPEVPKAAGLAVENAAE